MSLFTHDATYYSNQIKRREVTATQLVERAFKNIKLLDVKLNSVIHLQEQEALSLAKSYDAHISSLTDEEVNRLPSFYGVPILIKDLGQSEKGQPSISGSRLFKNHISKHTDNFVHAIIDAGYIIVGRTNVPEFGFKGLTDPELFGHTFSPIGQGLSSGGSSGGSGAAVKAGFVPIATAGDGGGSIRIPASFNGLIGLKPTRGRTITGPNGYRSWQGASVDFVLSKSVADTFETLKLTSNQVLESPYLAPNILPETLSATDRKLRIAYSYQSPVGTEIEQDAIDALNKTVEILKSLGHELVEDAPIVDGQRAMETYFQMNMVETAAMFKGIENSIGREVTKDDVELVSYGMYRAGQRVKGWQYVHALNFWDQLSADYHQFMDENQYEFLLTPTINGKSVPVDAFALTEDIRERLNHIDELEDEEAFGIFGELFTDSLAKIPYTQHANLTGQPALSLPLYETKDNLPVGSMFVARKGEEAALLELALQIENAGHIKSDIIDLR
ncbi:amidase family protein [Phocicoccus pinnipedialis]|uniref:Glutamyl-tRNA(Gln) amidotransferase subunit A n=1 Tax=Phocicoccus pinnipedialis TaxID=110845 RepID=A0A6V7RDL6_9BACL|nr:amidase family protein [Jeotgalicoccus pinnipedialis]MBP1939530.1 amidase [Jeotgalicoccus pinnipedialis]CAD2075012.1 Glutamyl-tRNA(Gln) amidotransferase subunit A [Jeotgalicoccus pinnipedialis]